MFEGFLKDVRYALRWLGRSPGFLLVAVLSLGLGIAFNTALFGVVDALLLRPLPVAQPERLVDVWTSGSTTPSSTTSPAGAMFAAILLTATAAANAVPALRASRVNPSVALRAD